MITQISAGANHNLSLDEAGNVYAWGSNEYGQCGRTTDVGTRNPGKEDDDIIAPRLVAVPKDAVLPFVKVSAGTAHSVLTDCTGQVFVAGLNGSGQIGSMGQRLGSADSCDSIPK